MAKQLHHQPDQETDEFTDEVAKALARIAMTNELILTDPHGFGEDIEAVRAARRGNFYMLEVRADPKRLRHYAVTHRH